MGIFDRFRGGEPSMRAKADVAPAEPVAEETPAGAQETPEEVAKREKWSSFSEGDVVEITLPRENRPGDQKIIAVVLDNAEGIKYGFKVEYAFLQPIGKGEESLPGTATMEVDVDSVRQLDAEEANDLKLEAAGGKEFLRLASQTANKYKQLWERHRGLGWRARDLNELLESVSSCRESLDAAVENIKQKGLDQQGLRDLLGGQLRGETGINQREFFNLARDFQYVLNNWEKGIESAEHENT